MEQIKRIISFFMWLLAGIFVLGVLLSLVMLVYAGRHSDEDSVQLSPAPTENAVAVVDIKGEILSSDSFRKAMRAAVKEKKIKAIVVRIDSPGGAVGASEEMFRMIKDADAKKPVICSFGNTAASGGLYAAMGCRKIFSNRNTLTGSIGVIFMMPNFGPVADRLGVSITTIKSGRFKDTGAPFRKMEPDEQALLQALVSASYEEFLQTVAQSRRLDVDAVRPFADGRVILGEDAQKKGLIDGIGGIEAAAKTALEEAGVSEAEPQLISIKKQRSLYGLGGAFEEDGVIQRLSARLSPRLLYRTYF